MSAPALPSNSSSLKALRVRLRSLRLHGPKLLRAIRESQPESRRATPLKSKKTIIKKGKIL
jgi:hypothetical protein